MKKSILFLLCICCLPFLSAQTSGVRLELPTEMVRNFQMGNNKLPSNVKGSPYLNKTFMPGVATIKDQSYTAILRYNAYSDEIEMKDEDNKNISLLKRDYITASFDGNNYEIINLGNKKGYVIVLEKGHYSLFKRYIKEFIPEKEGATSYNSGKPAQLIDNISYYIKIGDASAKQVKFRKNDLMNLLGEKEVKSYAKMNKSKLNSESEVINFIKKLNTK